MARLMNVILDYNPKTGCLMRSCAKTVGVVLFLALMLEGSPALSSTILFDSSKGKIFPIALSYQYWYPTQATPPTQTLNIYFSAGSVTPGNVYGGWTSFFDQAFSIRTTEDYIYGYVAPPLLNVGDNIYVTDVTSLTDINAVQSYLDGGGNSKILFPLVNCFWPTFKQGTSCPIIGFVGFKIDGADLHDLFGKYNDPPAISGIPPSSAIPGTSYVFAPTASDADGDPLTFSISNKPPWASFDPSTGTLSSAPGPSDAGYYDNIVISVSDGGFTASLPPFSITVPFPVKMTASGQPDQYFTTPAAAIAAVSAGSNYTIKCLGADFVGDITLDKYDSTVTLSGGYDSLFEARNGTTMIDGVLEINGGTLVVDGLVVGANVAP